MFIPVKGAHNDEGKKKAFKIKNVTQNINSLSFNTFSGQVMTLEMITNNTVISLQVTPSLLATPSQYTIFHVIIMR